ncbi:MAG: class B sortase [Oscillospiraceae bacterium]|jgi:sortase B|nr:class B sortase [Oscillospiraceae bacterium]
MREAAKIKAVRLANSAVDTAVLIGILLLVVIGCYAMWDSKQVYQAAEAARYGIYKPTAENGGKSFAELKTANPDVFAWLTVYGTHIDYPVVQGPDNMKYINTNAEGAYSLSGAIFLDSRSSRDFSDFSSILYGHHMEKSTMFGEIGSFAGKAYFDARKYGVLYYGGREHGLEFFAFVHADAYDGAVFRASVTGREAQEAYLDLLLSKALHTRDTQITANDRIVLLSTCSASSTNGRDILVAKVTDETRGDPFETNETDKSSSAWKVDGLPGLWARIPIWFRIVISIVPFILLRLWLLSFIRNKRHSRRKSRRGDERI